MADWVDPSDPVKTTWIGTPSVPVSVNNPLSSVAAIVYNADKIQGRPISPEAPVAGQGLVWNAVNELWVPGSVAAEIPFGSPGNSAVGDSLDSGVALSAVRADHRHSRETFASPAASAVGDVQGAGSVSTIPRSDHIHARESFAAPVASAPGDSQSPGVALSIPRSDHRHARETFGAPGNSAVGHSAAAGSAGTLARSDHQHGRETFGTPGSSAPADVAAQGIATTISRADHLHGREAHTSAQHGSSVVDHGAVGGLSDDDHPQYLLRSFLSAKGDLLTRDASALSRLPVGSDGHVLTADSTLTPGLKWAAVAGGGVTFDNPVASVVGDTMNQGVDSDSSRADHRHGRESFGIPGSSAVGDSVSNGIAVSVARSDHRHGRESFGAVGNSAVGDSAANGAATTLSRADHRHGREGFAIPGSSAPSDVAAAGIAATISRSDHLHGREAHGAAQHGSSVIDHGSAGGLSDDDHPQYLLRSVLTTKADLFVRDGSGIARLPVGTNGLVLTADSVETTGLKWAAGGGGGVTYDNPVASAVGDTMAQGVDVDVARADHRHAREAFGSPVTSRPEDASANGVATTVARSDHKHSREIPFNISLTAVSHYSSVIPVESSTGVAMTLNRLYALPFWVPKEITIDRLAVLVATAVTNATGRLGIYSSTAGFWPDSNLTDIAFAAGGLATTGAKEVTVNIVLSQGWHWFAFVTQTAAANLRQSGTGRIAMAVTALADSFLLHKGAYQDSVSGAMPSLFSATELFTATAPAIAFRRSA